MERVDVSAAIADIFCEGPWLRRTLQQLRPYICPFEALVDVVPSGARVLDIGCGSGLFLLLLAKMDRLREGVGLDLDAEAIAYANRIKTRLASSDRLTFVRDDGTLVWPRADFDVVTMIDVIHHVQPDQQPAMIERAARALAPNGVLVYKDMVRRPYWRAWANRAHDLVMARQWIHYLDFSSVVRIAGECGLTLERTAGMNRLWYGHELGVFRRT